MEIYFSLIVATINRSREIEDLLKSVRSQTFDSSKIEIIIVDQNNDQRLNEIVAAFPDLQITHLRSSLPGLSRSRNIGIRAAKGHVICFPDDDCTLYEDTLSAVQNELIGEDRDFVIGRITDRSTGKDIIRNWPSQPKKTGRHNFYFLSSSITLFVKRSVAPHFNESLGAGSAYGSCEDAEYIYRLLLQRRRGLYTPYIAVWHPTPNFSAIPLEKVSSYARGFGYFVSTNPDLTKGVLLIMLLTKKAAQFFSNCVNRRFTPNYFRSFFFGLWEGLRDGRRVTR